MNAGHTTEIWGQIEVIMHKEWLTKDPDMVTDEDVKLIDVPAEEVTFILGDFRDELAKKSEYDIIFDECESETVRDEQIDNLIAFCEPYRDKVPTLYNAALLANKKARFMYVTF